MEFQDRNLECIDCHASFVFTAGEQEFYDRKGFKEIPKRCKPCREKRKARRDQPGGGDDYGNSRYASSGGGGGGGGGRGGNYAAGGASSGGREMFDATCAACGTQARVPFRPAAGRPVYCRDCYAARSTGGY